MTWWPRRPTPASHDRRRDRERGADLEEHQLFTRTWGMQGAQPAEQQVDLVTDQNDQDKTLRFKLALGQDPFPGSGQDGRRPFTKLQQAKATFRRHLQIRARPHSLRCALRSYAHKRNQRTSKRPGGLRLAEGAGQDTGLSSILTGETTEKPRRTELTEAQ